MPCIAPFVNYTGAGVSRAFINNASMSRGVKTMSRLLPSARLLLGAAALPAAAQTALTPVEPKVSCSSPRGFDGSTFVCRPER
jgi:hypothetical protein